MGCRCSVEVGGLVGGSLEMGRLEVVEGARHEVCRRTAERKAWLIGGVCRVRGVVVEFNLGRY